MTETVKQWLHGSVSAEDDRARIIVISEVLFTMVFMLPSGVIPWRLVDEQRGTEPSHQDDQAIVDWVRGIEPTFFDDSGLVSFDNLFDDIIHSIRVNGWVFQGEDVGIDPDWPTVHIQLDLLSLLDEDEAHD